MWLASMKVALSIERVVEGDVVKAALSGCAARMDSGTANSSNTVKILGTFITPPKVYYFKSIIFLLSTESPAFTR